MAKRDYYDILGVSKGAEDSEIKAAYKKLAKKYHPDVSKEENAEEKFKEGLEAYKVLSDSKRRANYDRFGHAAESFGGGAGAGGANYANFNFEDLFSGFADSGFGDIFGGMFGGRGAQRSRRGSDIKHTLNLEFEEAAFGTEKEIEIDRVEKCDSCGGSGGEGGKTKTCEGCNGKGIRQRTQRTIFGVFSTATTCPQCNGRGELPEKECEYCKGRGNVLSRKKIKVKIPAGVNSGYCLRLNGEGNAGEYGQGAGDLYVVVVVNPHNVFRRDGSDVFCEVPIAFWQAALGGKIDVPTLHGKAELTVPSGTQTGTIFRLKGMGVRELQRSGKGDHYVKVDIETPKKLSAKEKELLRKFAKEQGRGPAEKFFDGLRNAFK